jgi:hypothetical protein
MWRGHAESYGVITARIMCIHYLEMQVQTKDVSEREFCRQVKDAMASERNMADVSVYNHNAAFAEIEGNTGLYVQSDKVNSLCAGDIDIAIDASTFGDGTVDYKLALAALTDQYGLDRLRFVLGCEVNWDSFFGRYPDSIYKWARDMKINENYGRCGVRTRPEYLLGLIEELRKAEPVKEKSVLAALDEGKNRVARADAARAEQNNTPTPKMRRGQEQGD